MDMKQQNELRNVFICYSNKFSLLFLSCCSSCALSFNPSLPFQRNAGRCLVWIPFWLSRRKVDVMLSLFKPSLNLKNFSACLLISNLKLWHNFIQKMQLDPCRNDCMPSWLRLAFASGIAQVGPSQIQFVSLHLSGKLRLGSADVSSFRVVWHWQMLHRRLVICTGRQRTVERI